MKRRIIIFSIVLVLMFAMCSTAIAALSVSTASADGWNIRGGIESFTVEKDGDYDCLVAQKTAMHNFDMYYIPLSGVIDVTGQTHIEIDIFVSDAAFFPSAGDAAINVGSGGEWDNNAINLPAADFKGFAWKEGWNHVKFALENFTPTDAFFERDDVNEYDQTSINFIRVYAYGNGPGDVTIKLANVTFTGGSGGNSGNQGGSSGNQGGNPKTGDDIFLLATLALLSLSVVGFTFMRVRTKPDK